MSMQGRLLPNNRFNLTHLRSQVKRMLERRLRRRRKIINMFKKLLAKAKPYIILFVLSQIIIVTVLVGINKGPIIELLKTICIIPALNVFILLGIQLQMVLLFWFSKKVILEIYSTLLLTTILPFFMILFSNNYTVEIKIVLMSMFETTCISGLYNRFVIAKIDQDKWISNRKSIKEKNDMNKITI